MQICSILFIFYYYYRLSNCASSRNAKLCITLDPTDLATASIIRY
jgi:hypothetical protein